MKKDNTRGRWIAIITGAFSVFIGVIYLLMITILDLRGGEMKPPPPEAFGVVVVDLFDFSLKVRQPF